MTQKITYCDGRGPLLVRELLGGCSDLQAFGALLKELLGAPPKALGAFLEHGAPNFTERYLAGYSASGALEWQYQRQYNAPTAGTSYEKIDPKIRWVGLDFPPPPITGVSEKPRFGELYSSVTVPADPVGLLIRRAKEATPAAADPAQAREFVGDVDVSGDLVPPARRLSDGSQFKIDFSKIPRDWSPRLPAPLNWSEYLARLLATCPPAPPLNVHEQIDAGAAAVAAKYIKQASMIDFDSYGLRYAKRETRASLESNQQDAAGGEE